MLNLCLHCGARHVERDAIARAPTPAGSNTWFPVPHHRLLEEVESTLTGSGLEIVNQAHALWNDGLRYFGLLEVRNGEAHDDYGLVIGLRNSHDKSFPAAIGLGSGVFVCDNLAFSAEVTIARRHTRFIERDLPRVVHTAVGRLADMRDEQDQRIDTYKRTGARRPRGARPGDPRRRRERAAGDPGAGRARRVAAAVVRRVRGGGQDGVAAVQRLHRNLEGPPSGGAAPPLAGPAWPVGCGLRPGRLTTRVRRVGGHDCSTTVRILLCAVGRRSTVLDPFSTFMKGPSAT